MDRDIERFDFWNREMTSKPTDKDIEQAFKAGRKTLKNGLYVFDSFYDYKKSLIKKS
jgi:hypothetical protein